MNEKANNQAPQIRLVEVGPRDGLQNESEPVSVDDKVTLINLLSEAGLRTIESGSFVAPRWVPQMANTDAVFRDIDRHDGVTYTALVPNLKGLEGAVASQVEEIAVFLAVSDAFSQKNINCTMAESITRVQPVVSAALEKGIKVRGYLSCVLGCPYAGEINPSTVASMSKQLIDMGCYEVSLGDTIGVGTSAAAYNLVKQVADVISVSQIAVHFHDTYGQALANIHAVLPLGVTVIDTAVAGLGGCPYAKGATGNVATEDVVYMLHGMQLNTGIDMQRLLDANRFISKRLGRPGSSRTANALLSAQEH